MNKKQIFARARRRRRNLLRVALGRVTIQHDPFKTTLALWRGKLCVTLQVVSLDDGKPCSIQFSYDTDHAFLKDVEDAIDWIYVSIRGAWVHELNELFCVDGKRRRDLHDAQGRTVTPPEDAFLHQMAMFRQRFAMFMRDAEALERALNEGR